MKILDELLKERETVTIDVVGDSITLGTQHCNADETYVAYFTAMLAKDYPKCTVNRYDGIPTSNELLPMKCFEGPIRIQEGTSNKIINVIRNGIGGNTVQRALNRIQDFTGILPDGNMTDITIFMFGINDALSSDLSKFVSVEQFMKNYKFLLSEVRRINGQGTVILMGPTWNGFGVEQYSIAVQEIAREEGLLFVDQFTVWKNHYNENAEHFGQGEWLSDSPTDSCHPTPSGSKQIALCMYNKLRELS